MDTNKSKKDTNKSIKDTYKSVKDTNKSIKDTITTYTVQHKSIKDTYKSIKDTHKSIKDTKKFFNTCFLISHYSLVSFLVFYAFVRLRLSVNYIYIILLHNVFFIYFSMVLNGI